VTDSLWIRQGQSARDVGADVVALDRRVKDGVVQEKADEPIPRNDVAGRSGSAADLVVEGYAAHGNTRPVANGSGAGRVRPDQVALEKVVAALQVEAIIGVAGDEVAGAGRRPADHGVRGGEYDPRKVAQRRTPGRVGPDDIALHHVADGG